MSTSDAETLLRSRRHRADNQVLRTTKDHHFQFPPLCLAVSVSFNFSCPHSVSLSLSFNFRSIQVHGELRQCALTPVRWVSQSVADWRRSAPPDPLGSRARQLLNLNPGLTFATAAAAVRAIALLGWRSCRGTSEPSAQLRCHCMAPHAPHHHHHQLKRIHHHQHWQQLVNSIEALRHTLIAAFNQELQSTLEGDLK